MPYEIVLNQKPMGYAKGSAREGEMAIVVAREFLSSEDGERFFTRMDGWPSAIIDALPSKAGIGPANVEHLVALIRQDLTATVYVNELRQVMRIRTAGPLESGQAVRERDIADVIEMQFEGLEVPAVSASSSSSLTAGGKVFFSTFLHFMIRLTGARTI
ncbi:MAG: hypothetical protein JO088_09255 [Acidobacteria bacterium]|nr:hypothetical protein [Acidobacteriota bacterium]